MHVYLHIWRNLQYHNVLFCQRFENEIREKKESEEREKYHGDIYNITVFSSKAWTISSLDHNLLRPSGSDVDTCLTISLPMSWTKSCILTQSLPSIFIRDICQPTLEYHFPLEDHVSLAFLCHNKFHKKWRNKQCQEKFPSYPFPSYHS